MAAATERSVGTDSGEQLSIYDDISERLAVGEFVPDARLKADELRRNYGVSAATIREVLFRLACGGYVVFEEQRGFRVPPASLELLLEVRHLRVLVESEAARLAIEKGDMEWEARLNAAHHKLAHVEVKMRDAEHLREHIVIWTRFDWEFHETLVSACGSKLLKETLRGLFYKYRQFLTGITTDHGFRKGTVTEHKAILDAALDRDADRCADAIRSHFAFLDNIETADSKKDSRK